MVCAEGGPETKSGAPDIEAAVAIQEALAALAGDNGSKSQVAKVLVAQWPGCGICGHPTVGSCRRALPALREYNVSRARGCLLKQPDDRIHARLSPPNR